MSEDKINFNGSDIIITINEDTNRKNAIWFRLTASGDAIKIPVKDGINMEEAKSIVHEYLKAHK
jgi:hypothetical protein